jgi:hypothetical protein
VRSKTSPAPRTAKGTSPRQAVAAQAKVAGVDILQDVENKWADAKKNSNRKTEHVAT